MKQLILLLLISLLVYSCCDEDVIQDTSKIKDFHQHYYETDKQQLSTNVDLYVDYSTCLSQKETVKSAFYKAIHPKIIACTPNYWSIKGENIKNESGDVYTLLNSIVEVNYADLKRTVEKIVQGKNQAILITDGEYYKVNSTGSNFNNPYLSESFTKWLKAGHDIYIYSEPYREANRYEKYRYYFVFTDRDLEDNIFHKISKDIDLGQVKLTKLSSTDFKVFTEYEGVTQPKVNPVLSINPVSYFAENSFEFQEYQIEWTDIVEYIQFATDPTTGAQLEGGDFVLRGIFIDTKSLEYFTIEDIEVKTYNVFDAFRSFEDSSFSPKSDELIEIKELFSIDEVAFQKTGEVVLKVHKNFNGIGLNTKADCPQKENLFKVDIVISRAKDNFTERKQEFNVFKFTSIDGNQNESIYQSIKNTLEVDGINPKKVNKGILYTIYIKTPTSNL